MLITWVEETNRLILNLILDSRSETEKRSGFLQGSEQRGTMKACFHFRVARETGKFSIADIKILQ